MAATGQVSVFDERHPSKGPQLLLRLSLAAVAGGALVGLVGAAFRWSLNEADDFRVWLVDWAHQFGFAGILIPIALAALAVTIARWIVVLVPEAAGSGVQRVEAAMKGQIGLESIRILPAKFIGGFLAIGAGLALGREGPLVQMGATVGSVFSKVLRFGKSSSRSLEAALSGAGLAAAFNAPIGGAVFVFEELTKTVRTRIVVPTLLGTAAAIIVVRSFLGDAALFPVGNIEAPSPLAWAGIVVFGCASGLLGGAYNVTILWFIDAFNYFAGIPVLVKAAIAGGLVGGLAWFAPGLVGGGDNITATQLLTTSPLLAVVFGTLILRWFLGPFSYAVGTPGGLFAPLISVGALTGALFAGLANLASDGSFPVLLFMVAGMGAFFAAVVRAPLTGVVLVAEMTATTSAIVPLIVACACASLTATLIRSEPIYDTLRHRMLAAS